MEIRFIVPDEFFSARQIDYLKTVLHAANKDELTQKLIRVAFASFDEYVQMLTGSEIPTKADEFRQYRLLFLIKHYFLDSIPSENQVAGMFQISDSKSKSLILNTISRFRNELSITLHQTLCTIIKSAMQPGNDHNVAFEVEIQSRNALDELNNLIQRKAPHLEKISQKPGSSGVYLIPVDTMPVLHEILGV